MATKNKLSHLDDVLKRIGSESPDATGAREEQAFTEFAGHNQNCLILFGAGSLGQMVLERLKQVEILPIAFADNDDRRWGTEIGGIPVLSPSVAADRYRDSACFVVTIYNGSPVRRQLRNLRCNSVAPFVALFWKYADVFTPWSGIDLPHNIPAFSDEIRACHDVLADEKSRCELAGQLEWRFWLDYEALPPSLDPGETYFPLELMSPSEDEVFVDCGSFQGDILPSFTSHWKGRFRHIFALEPDPYNRLALETNTRKMRLADRTTVIPYAVGNQNGTVSFVATGEVSSQIVNDGKPGISVECRKLDDISWPLAPTFIKMDIEGAEPEAIAGATSLIRQHHPILAICTYHRSEHLWQIPNLIQSIVPEYNLFLRRYAEECWEGVCYAIPNHRLKGS